MAAYKQSAAYTRLFKMIDSADHFTKKTGLTCTVNLSKAGAAFAAAGGTVTEVANGWYKIVLTTADTNTLGDLAYYITATGADDTDFVDQVTVRDIADLAFPATSGRSIVVDTAGLVDANTVKVGPTGSGTAQTAGDIPARLPAALTANGNMKSSILEWITTAFTEGATGRLAAAIQQFFNIASPTSTMNRITLVDTTTTNTDMRGTDSAATAANLATAKTAIDAIKVQTDKLTFTVANQIDANVLDWKSATAPAMTGDAFARLGAPAGASVSADVAAAKVDTAAIKLKTDQFVFTVANQVDSNALTGGGGLNAAGVRAAVGLASANLDTQLAATAQDSTVAKDATVAKASAISALYNVSATDIRTQAKGAIADYGGIL